MGVGGNPNDGVVVVEVDDKGAADVKDEVALEKSFFDTSFTGKPNPLATGGIALAGWTSLD